MRKKNNFDPDAMAKAGRERAALELDWLIADWVSAFKRWALSQGTVGSKEMNDLWAEFQLRNIEPPFDKVREEQRALAEEVRKVGSDHPGVAQAVADFERWKGQNTSSGSRPREIGGAPCSTCRTVNPQSLVRARLPRRRP